MEPAAHPDNPQPGFYRRKRKSGSDDAVAYFFLPGGSGPQPGTFQAELVCAVNGRTVTHGDELWQWVCDQPVTYDDYLARMTDGHWPNESTVVLGHNRPPADNTLLSVVSVFDALKAEAARLIKAGAASNQAQADQASDIANELNEVEKKAIALHKAEKAPILEKSRMVDRTWFPIRDAAA